MRPTAACILIKAVNIRNEPVEAGIILKGLPEGALHGTLYQMAGHPDEAANTYEQPDAIRPAEETFSMNGPEFSHVFPARSVTVLRIAAPSTPPRGK